MKQSSGVHIGIGEGSLADAGSDKGDRFSTTTVLFCEIVENKGKPKKVTFTIKADWLTVFLLSCDNTKYLI